MAGKDFFQFGMDTHFVSYFFAIWERFMVTDSDVLNAGGTGNGVPG